MEELNGLIAVLQIIFSNPWMLAFGLLWVIAYMLKEHTSLNNKLIPWIIIILAAGLGFALISPTFPGAIIGVIMGYVIIGFYSHIKNTIEFIKG